jgi:hypothetical protein
MTRDTALRAAYPPIAGLIALLLVLLPFAGGAFDGSMARAYAAVLEQVQPQGQGHTHHTSASAHAGIHCEDSLPAEHNHAGDGSEGGCCGIGMCHAVQLIAHSSVAAPSSTARALRPPLLQQFAATGPARLDEPPRTL